ncbi:MAG: diaminopimelate epimerase [bacterium]|nr:diaminopimelate epimerase [bacterium]
MRFTKMHGLGNDYVFVNCLVETVSDPGGVARAIADRSRGVGSDGLILICESADADVRMEMYNADGSRGPMCGNGIRCVAKYAFERGLTARNPMRIETDTGVLEATLTVEDGRVVRVAVDMGRPSLAPQDLPCTLEGDRIVDQPLTVGDHTYAVTCVSTGSAHVVIFVDDLEAVPLAEVGPLLERAPVFPERVNVHFARVDSRDAVTIRTWERGSGITQACGTGATAVCVAGAVTGRTGRRITATLPGGDLELEWTDDDHVHMAGPAEEVFDGHWPASGRIGDCGLRTADLE